MVDLIFTLINFAVLLALGYYIFKKYALPDFQRETVDQLKYMQNLKNEESELVKKQNILQDEMALQQTRCKELIIKASAWEKAVINERRTAELEYQQNQERIQRKLRTQSAQYSLDRNYTQIAPEVIQLLTHDLENYYQNVEHARKYISHALNQLEKNNA